MFEAAQDLPDITETLNFAEQMPDQVGEKFVVFTQGNELFAVPAGLVSEVVQPLFITHLPNVPEWLTGITNNRGEVVSIVYLPKLWQINTPKNFAKPKLIILQGKYGKIALAADGLREIVTLPDEIIQLREENSHILADAETEELKLQIINTEKLFSDINSAV